METFSEPQRGKRTLHPKRIEKLLSSTIQIIRNIFIPTFQTVLWYEVIKRGTCWGVTEGEKKEKWKGFSPQWKENSISLIQEVSLPVWEDAASQSVHLSLICLFAAFLKFFLCLLKFTTTSSYISLKIVDFCFYIWYLTSLPISCQGAMLAAD